MKKLLFLTFVLVLFSALSFGQITLEVNEKDDFTGSIKKFTKSSARVFKGEKTYGTLYIAAGRVDSLTFISLLVAEDLGCLSEYDGKIMIKLTDGTVIECYQFSDTECSSTINAARYLPLKREEAETPERYNILAENIKKLTTTTIGKIRVYGSESYNDYIPNAKFKEYNGAEALMKHLVAVQ